MPKIYLYLITILLIAAILRFIGLERFSPSLNRDEAGIGYNAYSLLLTGKDEHGVAWPLSFESIGDYKMPGYIYLSMLQIKIWGLSVFATRITSALAGVMAVWGLYLVTFEITKLLAFKQNKAHLIALISGFLLAINPWHIHYSRLAFEANVNLTIFIYSIWFLLKGLEQNKYLFGTVLLWVVMQFMYSSTFVFLPLFILIMILLFVRYKPFFNFNKIYILIAVVMLLFGSTMAIKSVTAVSSAKTSITIFSDPYLVDKFNHLRGELQSQNPLLAKLTLNKFTYFGPIILRNYLTNFSPGFLFANAIHHPWHGIYGQGYFYWLDGVGFIVGLLFLVKKSVNSQKKFPTLMILTWILLAPAASVITVDAPHATRSLYLLPVFLIIAGLGLWEIINFLTNRLLKQKKLVIILLLTLYSISFIKATYQYLIIYPIHQDKALFPGVKDVLIYADSIKQNRLVYMPEVSSSAYIYYLFFTRTDPKLVQQTASWKGRDTAGLTHIEAVGQWRFVDNKPPIDQKIIWIDRASNEIIPGLNLLKEFKNPNTDIIEWKLYEN